MAQKNKSNLIPQQVKDEVTEYMQSVAGVYLTQLYRFKLIPWHTTFYLHCAFKNEGKIYEDSIPVTLTSFAGHINSNGELIYEHQPSIAYLDDKAEPGQKVSYDKEAWSDDLCPELIRQSVFGIFELALKKKVTEFYPNAESIGEPNGFITNIMASLILSYALKTENSIYHIGYCACGNIHIEKDNEFFRDIQYFKLKHECPDTALMLEAIDLIHELLDQGEALSIQIMDQEYTIEYSEEPGELSLGEILGYSETVFSESIICTYNGKNYKLTQSFLDIDKLSFKHHHFAKCYKTYANQMRLKNANDRDQAIIESLKHKLNMCLVVAGFLEANRCYEYGAPSIYLFNEKPIAYYEHLVTQRTKGKKVIVIPEERKEEFNRVVDNAIKDFYDQYSELLTELGIKGPNEHVGMFFDIYEKDKIDNQTFEKKFMIGVAYDVKEILKTIKK